MIDQNQLLHKLKSLSSLTPLLQSSRLSQLKLAKIIYSNRQVRDIRKFVAEANEIRRKSKHVNEDNRVKTQNSDQKGSYDENQLKELTFRHGCQDNEATAGYWSKQYAKYEYEISKAEPTMRRRHKSKPKIEAINRSRKLTSFGEHSLMPGTRGRMNSINLIPESPKPRFSDKEGSSTLSPLKLRKKQQNPQPQPKITLREQDLNTALDFLCFRVGKQNRTNLPLPRELIFNTIEERYKFKEATGMKNNSVRANQYYDPQFDRVFRVEIPYCQFNTIKDSKISIDRIFNMSVRAAQRIVFKIYDRNGNGVIDQKDIIELFSIADQFPSMQQDLEVVVKNYRVGDKTKSSRENQSLRHTGKVSLQSGSCFSISRLDRIRQQKEEAKKPSKKQNNKFQRSKYFTFRETKQEFVRRKYDKNTVIQLTWQNFEAAFRNKRPELFYDVLDFLFNVDSRSIYRRQKTKDYQEFIKNQSNFVIFNNFDGKSESGKSQVVQEAQLQAKSLNKKGSSKFQSLNNKLMVKKSHRYEQEKMPVEAIINKARTIEKLEKIRYD